MRAKMRISSLLGLAAILLAAPASAQNANWVTAWGTSQQGLAAQTKITNASVRKIARVTLPGDAVRIRLDNTIGHGYR